MDQIVNETVVPRGKKDLSTVKRYLSQVGILSFLIGSMKYQMNFASEQAYSLASSSNFRNTRVQTSQSSEAAFVHAIEDAVDREEDIKKYVARQYNRIVDYKNQVLHIINQYTVGVENFILTSRYISGHTWKQISEEVHLCEKQVHRIHENALAKIVLPEDAIWIL